MPTTEELPASPIGRPRQRVDGPLKVSGTAKYTSDFNFPGMLYAVPVPSTIANGRIEKIDSAGAEKMPGVRAIYHRQNIGKIFRAAINRDFTANSTYQDEHRPPLEDDEIRYYGQYVALAVADTFEQAKAAADAVAVTYAPQPADVSPPKVEAEKKWKKEGERGDPDKAFTEAPVKLDETYATPVETHNPIELHATVAVWDGAAFTLYETTQAVVNHRGVMVEALGVPKENVRVISKFLGSGFGGKLWPWTHSALAAVAARNLGKPVKLVISRKMMFQTVGHRPRIEQRIRIGAQPNGKLTSLQHDYVNHTSILDDYKENCGEATPYFYSVPNLRVMSGLTRRNVGVPTSMRGPGAVPGLYASESALDELAFKLKMDPVELRLLNEPKIDEGLNIPFSSRHMTECLTTGAEKFGWSKRTPEIGSMKRDGLTLGWGMAGCSWIAARFACEAIVEIREDGSARVACGTQDIGTGTYTVLAVIVSEKLGIPVDKVEVVLGDTALPAGPVSGGSMVSASVIPAVSEAAKKALEVFLKTATTLPNSPFAGRKPEDLVCEKGRVRAKDESLDHGVPFGTVLKLGNIKGVSGHGSSKATFGEKPKFSTHSYGAHFIEVTWEPETARLRVARVVTVIDAGKIINPLAGRNQIEGAVVMGIGMALFEETRYDPRNGAPINSNLADYVVATNADVPPINVHFLDYPDLELNELGARGIGEIGLAGTAAAIANAVHHATGKRVRALPIRLEDLLV